MKGPQLVLQHRGDAPGAAAVEGIGAARAPGAGSPDREEKALGKPEKIGRRTRYVDVLGPAEEPARGPGLCVMDTSCAAAGCENQQAAAGFAVHLSATGQDNVVGRPAAPVVRLTANPRTAGEMSEHIDLDVSGILRREMSHDEAGDALIGMTLRVCSGRHTCAEAPGHREFVMTRLHRSARSVRRSATRTEPS